MEKSRVVVRKRRLWGFLAPLLCCPLLAYGGFYMAAEARAPLAQRLVGSAFCLLFVGCALGIVYHLWRPSALFVLDEEGIEGPFLPGGRQKILWQEVAGLQLEDLGHDPVIAFYLAEPDRVKRSRRARRQIRQSQAQGQGGLRMDTKEAGISLPQIYPQVLAFYKRYGSGDGKQRP